MDIFVCIKQTLDTEAVIVLAEDGGIDASDAIFILNPYDEYAVEEAVSLKEKFGGKVTALSASFGDPSKALQQCVAMGADEAVIISDPALAGADAHVTALALSRFLEKEAFDLILCGREAVDDGASEVPSRLAELLDLPQVNVVSKLEVNDGSVSVTRDIDGGSQFIRVPFPCLISVQKGINEPRYPSMRNILQAKRKPIHRVGFTELSIASEESKPVVDVKEITLAQKRSAGEVFKGPVEETVDRLIEVIKGKTKICQ